MQGLLTTKRGNTRLNPPRARITPLYSTFHHNLDSFACRDLLVGKCHKNILIENFYNINKSRPDHKGIVSFERGSFLVGLLLLKTQTSSSGVCLAASIIIIYPNDRAISVITYH